jgi:D-beta-D-heptose 7-phosphate kinase/D-beta-D-heptose 1-phosphate adenosyltransferase
LNKDIPSIDPSRAQAILSLFPSLQITIVGDVMLDEFIFGRVNRISPEAPVPILEFDHDEIRIGGAGNVAYNLQTLGASVELIGVVGKDADAEKVLDALKRSRIGVAGVVHDPDRRTTKKVRLVTTRNQQVARVDYEMEREVTGTIEAALLERLEQAAASAKAIVISDYLKGAVTQTLASRAIEIGRNRKVPVLVDPKIPHIDYYTGAAVVTPNNQEAEAATHTRIRNDDDARAAARAIRKRTRCDSVLITRGESGMWLLDDTVEGRLATAAREVADVTGAGDTVIATLALALAAGGTVAEAASLANVAAGVTVSKFGPAAVTPEEFREALHIRG